MLADTSNLPTRMVRLQQRFSKEPGHRIGRVKKVQFTFDELKRARDLIFTEGLSTVGWSRLDVNEARNRVVVDVPNAAGIGRARAALHDLGLSNAMVEVEVEPTVYFGSWRPDSCAPDSPTCGSGGTGGGAAASCPSAGLPCPQSSLVGGIEIEWPTVNGPAQCSLGALVQYKVGSTSSTTLQGFLTAMHCSLRNTVVDNTIWTQGIGSVANAGVEAYDPAATGGPSYNPCPAGYVCRFSDALLANVAPSAPFSHGYIAKTTYANGSDTTQARYISNLLGYHIQTQRTLGVSVNLSMGATVRKVGWRSGTTDGRVINTCSDFSYGLKTPAGTPIVMQCQYEVAPLFGGNNRIAGTGDSGGSVFTDAGNGQVQFEGILVSGTPDPNDPFGRWDFKYIFSPLSGIQSDLLSVNVIGVSAY
jgi:hypothetical protein